jgi:RNA polymerase sigma factor (sigma-70 family)
MYTFVPDQKAKGPLQTLLSEEAIAVVQQDIALLKERDEYIIRQYFIERRTHEEIGETLTLSRERVRQLIVKVFDKHMKNTKEYFGIQDTIKLEL